MKRYLAAAVIGALAAGTAAWADDAHQVDWMGGSGMHSMSPAMPGWDATTRRMQENVKHMQSQIDAIDQAKDDTERDRLLAEHFQAMRDHMVLGQTMMHGGAMGMMGPGRGMAGRPWDAGTIDECVKVMADAGAVK